jgi:flagellar operon protein
MINKLLHSSPTKSLNRGQIDAKKSTLHNEFASLLKNSELTNHSNTVNKPSLVFSKHAVSRMQTRSIRFSPEDVMKLNTAVEKASNKGSRNVLVLSKEAALVVDVRENKVITVMGKDDLKDNIFTNIDSTVLI